MARINIEESLHKDKRFEKLMFKLGSKRMALGALVEAYILAQQFYLTSVNARLIPLDVWSEQEIAPEILECGLAEIRENGVYVCGADEQFAWLIQKSEAGKKSGASRAKKTSERPLTSVNSRSTSVNVSEPPSLPPSLNTNTVSRVLDTSPPPKKSSAKATYSMTEPSDFTGLMSGYITGWVELYDAEYIKREVSKAVLWLKANPQKNKKTLRGWVAFFGGWFDRGWSQHNKYIQTNKSMKQQGMVPDV